MVQKIELKKTRDFSAKINITFDFLRQNFKPMALAIIYISGPFILVQGIFMGIYQQKTLALGPDPNSIFGAFRGELLTSFGLAMAFSWLAYVVTMIVIFEFVRLYESRPDPTTIETAEIWAGVKDNFLLVFASGFVTLFYTLLGTVLLIIPGIYVSICLTLVVPILVIEKLSIGEAVSRSFKLINEKWWSTFGLLVVTLLISSFMGFVFAIPQSIFTFIIALHKVEHEAALEPALWERIGIMASSLLATVGSNMLHSIVLIALAFQFYNLVERRESRGLMEKLESFGKGDSNAPRHDETY